MKKFGKTIKQFLVDGNPNGRISAELSNWTGKAFKIPRTLIKESADRIELAGTGVYFLIGKDSDALQNAVYIGEADGILPRIKQHFDKDFWTEVIVFVSKDDNLNKAHIKYLEHHLYNLAKDAGRYKLMNANKPTKSSISEADQAEMNEFMENMKLLVNNLGYKVFDKLLPSDKDNHNKFFILKKEVSASGTPTDEGFVIFKGSKIINKNHGSVTQTLIELRTQLINEKVIGEENLTFLKDHLFSSPSTAATLVLGRSSNGRIEWKMKNGKTLKEFEEN